MWWQVSKLCQISAPVHLLLSSLRLGCWDQANDACLSCHGLLQRLIYKICWQLQMLVRLQCQVVTCIWPPLISAHCGHWHGVKGGGGAPSAQCVPVCPSTWDQASVSCVRPGSRAGNCVHCSGPQSVEHSTCSNISAGPTTIFTNIDSASVIHTTWYYDIVTCDSMDSVLIQSHNNKHRQLDGSEASYNWNTIGERKREIVYTTNWILISPHLVIVTLLSYSQAV